MTHVSLAQVLMPAPPGATTLLGSARPITRSSVAVASSHRRALQRPAIPVFHAILHFLKRRNLASCMHASEQQGRNRMLNQVGMR